LPSARRAAPSRNLVLPKAQLDHPNLFLQIIDNGLSQAKRPADGRYVFQNFSGYACRQFVIEVSPIIKSNADLHQNPILQKIITFLQNFVRVILYKLYFFAERKQFRNPQIKSL
jgi:hypothetical protein